jgi:formiminoglutamase
MQFLKHYSQQDILKLTRKRSGETKIGEVVSHVSANWKNELKNNDSKFVILGIAEDIGVRANYGRAGASTAFIPALDSFLSQQNNLFLNATNICVLGEIVVEDLMTKAEHLNLKNKNDVIAMRDLVSVLDERVSDVIQYIISLNKIPIVIGGGHNNSYGNIKGASLARHKKINVINCDPHLDFRPLEGRHSGNGFSYAYNQGFINKYAVFAMHEQYNNAGALQKFKEESTHLYYNTYESIFVREELEMSRALKHCLGFVKDAPCGVELDLDAITNVPSSAKTSSGISPVQARQYVYQCASQLNPLYLHVAEGAPVLSHIKADNKTGKLIAYLISDFIKGCNKTAD